MLVLTKNKTLKKKTRRKTKGLVIFTNKYTKMKKKIIVSISIFLSIIISVTLLNINSVTVDVSKVPAMQTRFESFGTLEYREIKLDKDNCKFSLDQKTDKVQIEEYKGNEDCIVIPEKINGYSIDGINPESFSDCYNLEIIKIPTSIAEKIIEISDFEIREEISNDEYTIYKTTREYSEVYIGYLELSDEEKSKVGVIPNKYDVPIEKLYSKEMQELYDVKSNSVTATTSKYDLRDYIDIDVENQRGFGICYAYASFSSVETNLALTKNEYVDFSEIHAAVMKTGNGGVLFSASDSYYASKIGPVYEEIFSMKDIYGNTSNPNYTLINKYLSGETVTSTQIKEIQNFVSSENATKYVTKTVNLPSITQTMKNNTSYNTQIDLSRDVIKKHIMNYGSIGITINSSGCCEYNGRTVLNTKSAASVDHGVSIIGWDDNFSRDNFPASCRPSKNGAYLVLNSWGNAWGEDGYFWISYEDKFVETNLVGVVAVEEITSNMTCNLMTITNNDTLEEIQYGEIERGTDVGIYLEINLKELLENPEIEIKLKNSKDDFSEYINLCGSNIENNIFPVHFDLDTSNLKPGDYIIEIKYGNETLTRLITITADFEYVVNADGTITITSYIGEDKNVIVPTKYRNYQVSEIGESAFAGTGVENVTIEDGISKIGKYCFKECLNLKSVRLPNNITEINYETFNICVSLENINIPNNVKIIGGYAFSNCQSLKNIELSPNITTIGERAFNNCIILESISIPEKVTTICDYAFCGCTNITEANLSKDLKVIGDAVFLYCEKLGNLEIPNSVTEIGSGVFQNCYALKELKFPRSVTSIGEVLFYGCKSLEKVIIFKETNTIGQAILYGVTGTKIYCEENSVAHDYAKSYQYSYKLLSNYQITYNSNSEGDTVNNMPNSEIKVEYDDTTISNKIPEREGYNFLGWSKTQDTSSVDYMPGDTYKTNESLNLYAVWSENFVIQEIDVDNFNFKNATFVYDGTEKTIVSLGHDTNIVDVKYSINPNSGSTLLNGKAIEAGTYTIKATYTIKDERKYSFKNNINEKTAILTIEKATYDMSNIKFENVEYVYCGREREIVVRGYLPLGVSVSYENNKAIDVGTYNAVARFTGDSKNYNEISNLKATLTITKATYDMSDVKFESLVYTYDGTEKIVEISGNLPEGVEVTYENNKAIDGGTYNAVAKFTGDSKNYNEIPNMKAYLIINPSESSITINNKENLSKVYDGNPIELFFTQSREGNVIIEYYNRETGKRIQNPVDVGRYWVNVILEENKNYLKATDVALFEITKATYDMSNVRFENAEYTYDGTEKKIEILGYLPEGVEVSYENNKATDVGVYNAVANFTVKNKNYNEIPSMEAVLRISLSESSITINNKENLSKVYDGNPIKVSYTKTREGNVRIEYYSEETGEPIKTPVDAGIYTVKVILEASDNYSMAVDSATFEIRKSTYDMSNVRFENAEYTYDGTEKKVEISGNLPEGVEVSYENNTATDVGVYNAVANFIGDTRNYNEIPSMEAELKIRKATYDMSNVRFENTEYTYDGTEKKIEISGNLPEGVEVTYENNTATDVGVYNAVANFIGDARNYNEIPSMEANLKIIPLIGTIAINNKENLSKIYDGNPIELSYTKTREGVVLVEYYVGTEAIGEKIEAPTEVGTYTVKIIQEANNNFVELIDFATFEIRKATYDMSNVRFENTEYTYDGTEKKVEISGNLPEGVEVTYERNVAKYVGEYNAVAKFTGDTKNYNEIPSMTAILKITSATGTISITNKILLNKTYDKLEATLPRYVASREGNVRIEYYAGTEAVGDIIERPTKAGIYTVKVILEADENNLEATDTATFEIIKATYNMSNVRFEDVEYIYDGIEKKVEIIGEIPDGVTVTYENNKAVEVGTYKAVAKFEGDYTNYNAIPNMEAVLNIIITNIDFGSMNVKQYDGNNYIEAIEEGMTIKQLKEQIDCEEIEVFLNGNIIENDEQIITTGMKIVIFTDQDFELYNTIIKGDITRDGKVNDADLLMLAKYMVDGKYEKEYINNTSLLAADLYEDNVKIDDRDLLKLATMLLK